MLRCSLSAGSGSAARDALRGGGQRQGAEGPRSPAAMRRMPLASLPRSLRGWRRDTGRGGAARRLPTGAALAQAGAGAVLRGGDGPGPSHPRGAGGAGPALSPPPAGCGRRRRPLPRHALFTAAAAAVNTGQGALAAAAHPRPFPAARPRELPARLRWVRPRADRLPPRSPCRTCLFHLGL